MYSLIHRECFGEETPALSFHELPRRTVSEMCGWCNGPRLLLCRARVSCTTENWQAGIVTGTTQGLSTGSQELGPSFLLEPSFPPQASHLSAQVADLHILGSWPMASTGDILVGGGQTLRTSADEKC